MYARNLPNLERVRSAMAPITWGAAVFPPRRASRAVFVKLHNAKAFRVVDEISEDGRLAVFGMVHGLGQHPGKAVAGKDIIPQHHGRLAANEILPDQNACASPSGEAAPRRKAR